VEFSVTRPGDGGLVDCWRSEGAERTGALAHCYPRAIQYIADGTVAADRIVTHTLPLERFREAIELVHSQTESVKVVMIP
jgi:threonine dehydrogenase-like Zn-dependent dehydrogenase